MTARPTAGLEEDGAWLAREPTGTKRARVDDSGRSLAVPAVTA